MRLVLEIEYGETGYNFPTVDFVGAIGGEIDDLGIYDLGIYDLMEDARIQLFLVQLFLQNMVPTTWGPHTVCMISICPHSKHVPTSIAYVKSMLFIPQINRFFMRILL